MSLRATETRHHPEGKTCHHFVYHWLTCDEYDALRARAAGHCEVCGIDERLTKRGSLVIDHFDAGDDSFVRGMACDTCNTVVLAALDGRRPWDSEARSLENAARAYEANSWQKPSPRALALMAARTEMATRGSGRAPDGYVRVRMGRAHKALWARFGDAVQEAEPELDRSKVLREYMRWYVGDTDRLPRSPRDSQ